LIPGSSGEEHAISQALPESVLTSLLDPIADVLDPVEKEKAAQGRHFL
jgi:hypothetical protein